MSKIKGKLPGARKAAWLIPMVSEFMYRTHGFHSKKLEEKYLSQGYKRLLGKCDTENIVRFMNPKLLFYSVLHWAGYRKLYEAVDLHINDDVVP
ncbi:hypothetical protein FBU59_000943 [Linderina macrospora]|uniref:Uncharacterized protein n=1 Tax=Linderina macrospora TaxID=4868 RepID=A0ACC1JFP2_9FUNG|nr:hypothetical protein FBU59_000943 [Linderina macrospora]